MAIYGNTDMLHLFRSSSRSLVIPCQKKEKRVRKRERERRGDMRQKERER
jgi:hypothetical protein